MVDDGGEQDLEGGGGAETAAGQDPAAHIGVKAGDGEAAGSDPGGHAADQRGARPRLPGARLQRIQRDLTEGTALGEQADQALPVRGDGRRGIQIDGPGQHLAQLMVGVVAAQLRAPGGGEEKPGGLVIQLAEFTDEFFVHNSLRQHSDKKPLSA